MPWADRFIKVQVAGNDLTANTLDGVQVSAGTRDWWDQNVNGYARITLYDQQPNVAIGDELTVEVEAPEEAATGGTITSYTSGGVTYMVHTFTSNGTFTVTHPIDVDVLMVGGGGSGAYQYAGGGGGGGVLLGSLSLSAGTYPVVIGAGGTAPTTAVRGNSGGNTTFAGYTAFGGGGAGSWNTASQRVGGSGGSGGGGSMGGGSASASAGGSATQTSQGPLIGYGNGGGSGWRGTGEQYKGGGGGGAGAPGANAPQDNTLVGGAGGNGIASAISGVLTYYGGGGGGASGTFIGSATLANGGLGGGGKGGADASAVPAGIIGENGVNGLGGGGGGSPTTQTASRGGSGVVIIRYPDPTQRLFTGTVASIETQLTTAGPFWTVQASGPLTKLGRRVLNQIVPADLDGDQIRALVLEGLSVQWQQVGTAWSDQTLTYGQFAIDTTEIDTPGVYQLDAITDTPVDVLDALVIAAESGQGWLYETHQGTLGYGDSTRRDLTPADEFVELPGDSVELQSVLSVTTDADLVNQAVVEWSGGEVVFNSSLSQGLYGLYSRNFRTTLDDSGDATDYAIRRVTLDGAPRTSLPSGVRVNLRLLDDDQLDACLAITRNSGLIIEDFPTYLLPEGRFRGFVEGYVWTIGPITATLDLYVSDYALSVFGLRWAATGTVAWQDVAATVTWADTEESL